MVKGRFLIKISFWIFRCWQMSRTQMFLQHLLLSRTQRRGAGQTFLKASLEANVLWEFGTYQMHICPLLSWFPTPQPCWRAQRWQIVKWKHRLKNCSLCNSPVEFIPLLLTGWHRGGAGSHRWNHIKVTSSTEAGQWGPAARPREPWGEGRPSISPSRQSSINLPPLRHSSTWYSVFSTAWNVTLPPSERSPPSSLPAKLLFSPWQNEDICHRSFLNTSSEINSVRTCTWPPRAAGLPSLSNPVKHQHSSNIVSMFPWKGPCSPSLWLQNHHGLPIFVLLSLSSALGLWEMLSEAEWVNERKNERGHVCVHLRNHTHSPAYTGVPLYTRGCSCASHGQKRDSLTVCPRVSAHVHEFASADVARK